MSECFRSWFQSDDVSAEGLVNACTYDQVQRLWHENPIDSIAFALLVGLVGAILPGTLISPKGE